MNVHVFKTSVPLPHCTVILSMRGSYCSPASQVTSVFSLSSGSGAHSVSDEGTREWNGSVLDAHRWTCWDLAVAWQLCHVFSALELSSDSFSPLDLKAAPWEDLVLITYRVQRVLGTGWVFSVWRLLGLVKTSRSVLLFIGAKNHDHVKPKIARHLWTFLQPTLRRGMDFLVAGYQVPT